MSNISDINQVDKLINKAFALINEDKNTEAIEIVNAILKNNVLQTEQLQFIADIYLAVGDFDKASICFQKTGNLQSSAFALIMSDKPNEAKALLDISESAPVTLWCNFLYDVFSSKAIRQWPSFLGIRHFMELTVYSLLLSKKTHLINLLFKRTNKLLDINIDTEKYIGYAYYHYGDIDQSIKFLKTSLRRNRTDGEIYFTLGQIYNSRNDLKEALSMLENAKTFMPNHYPTNELLKKVKEKLVT